MKILDYTFVNPWMFSLLIIIPLMSIWYVWKLKNAHTKFNISSSSLIKGVNTIYSYLRHIPYILSMIGIIFLIIAMARPQNQTDDNNITEQSIIGVDIVLSIDISFSMMAQDFSPNRLEAAKDVAKEFIKKRENDRIGLVVYEGASITQCALTTDKETLLKKFEPIKSGMLGVEGTAIGMGISTAINRLRDSDAKSKIIILLTDGENNTGKIDPISAAKFAKEYDIRVYTIGVGSLGTARMPVGKNPYTNAWVYQQVPVKIDEKTLKEISSITDGKYFRAKSKSELENIYKEIDSLEKSKLKTIKFKRDFPEKFHVFVTLALIFLSLAFVFNKFIFRTI